MGRETYAQRSTYIRNYARTLMGQLGIDSAKYEPCLWLASGDQLDAASCCSRIVSELLKDGFHLHINSHLTDRSDRVIGRLAMSAPGRIESGMQNGIMNLERVFDHRNAGLALDTRFSGWRMVRQIALASVIAAISEDIYLDLMKK